MEKMQQVDVELRKNIPKLLECGAQAVTLGNHAWDNREVFEFIDDAKYLARPANFQKELQEKGLFL